MGGEPKWKNVKETWKEKISGGRERWEERAGWTKNASGVTVNRRGGRAGRGGAEGKLWGWGREASHVVDNGIPSEFESYPTQTPKNTNGHSCVRWWFCEHAYASTRMFTQKENSATEGDGFRNIVNLFSHPKAEFGSHYTFAVATQTVARTVTHTGHTHAHASTKEKLVRILCRSGLPTNTHISLRLHEAMMIDAFSISIHF